MAEFDLSEVKIIDRYFLFLNVNEGLTLAKRR